MGLGRNLKSFIHWGHMKNHGRKRWILWGLDSNCGQKIAELSATSDNKPILAGTDPQVVYDLAKKYQLEARVFDLGGYQKRKYLFSDVGVLVNCSSHSNRERQALISACAKAKISYLDRQSNFQQMDATYKLAQLAKNSGVTVIPGISLTTFPLDVIASRLKSLLPDAVNVKLAYMAPNVRSSYSFLSSFPSNLTAGFLRRTGGRIAKQASKAQNCLLPIHDGQQCLSHSFPLPSLVSVWHATKIPNIETYIASHPKEVRWLKFFGKLRWLIHSKFVQQWIKNRFSLNQPISSREVSDDFIAWGESIQFFRKKNLNASESE